MVLYYNISQVLENNSARLIAAIKVAINIMEALECKKYCAALFIDLSKAIDTNIVTQGKPILANLGML